MRFPLRLLLGLLLALAPLWLAGQVADAAPASDAPATYSLAKDRRPVTSLTGLWRFQPGDDPRWAEPWFDDTSWALVASDRDWSEIGYGNLSGVGWYRFRIVLPADTGTYSLSVPEIYTCYQLFADGQLLLTQGKLPPNPVIFHTRPALVTLTTSPTTQPRPITIALRIWEAPAWSQYRSGGLQGVMLVGHSDLLATQFDDFEARRRWGVSDWLDLSLLDLLACVISLALYFSRRSEQQYLWFSLLVLGAAGSHLMSTWEYLRVCPIFATEAVKDSFLTLFLVASLLFFQTLLNGNRTLFFKFALLYCPLWFVDGLIAGPAGLSTTQQNFGGLLFTLPIYLWIILLVGKRYRQRHRDARLLLFPVLLLFGALFYHQFVWTLETAGLGFARYLYIRIRHPFYLTLEDVAEAFFLLAMLGILLNRFARTRRDQDRIASELDAARSVQQLLVPAAAPVIPGLAIATAYHPAQEVGGDFFQILPLPSGGVLVVIGDVAGKGLPAALTVSLAVGSLRTLADFTDAPGEILAGLNRRLHVRGSGFTTCLALRFSPDCAVLTVANAGHLPPYVNGFELATEPSLPLGLDPAAFFAESRFGLAVGDHLTVLTDGVPEAMHGRTLFGFERTQSLSRGHAAYIADAARDFGQADDITVLTIDVVPTTAAETPRHQPALAPA